ncbi:MAG: DUF2252 domain-containing protein [Steroidobacteraceae bacterium]
MARQSQSGRASGVSQGKASHPSADERAAKGKALREMVPRTSHSEWKPYKGRRDPVELTLASDDGRIEDLVPIRHGRMSASPFAFFRGSAALMAADLARTPTSGIRVQACGDAHLMNFGGFATPERNVIFDINDFDETLPAPFEWDLKRLAASAVIAAQYLTLRSSDTARVAAGVAREYRKSMRTYATMRARDVWYERIDLQRYQDRGGDPKRVASVRAASAKLIKEAKRRAAPEHQLPKLVARKGARLTIKDAPPLIYHPTAEIAPGMKFGYAETIAAYREALPANVRILFDRFQFRDLATKIVGVGSVGTQCYVALLMAAENDPLFLQIKEARRSVLEPYAGNSVHSNQGQRVVEGQRLMQSASDVFLGWARGTNKRDFYLRQLMDMKVSATLDEMDAKMLHQYSRMCAHALALAHARAGDAAMIAGYLGSGPVFDDAIGEFAFEYAGQNAADYRSFITAIREGRVKARIDSQVRSGQRISPTGPRS